MVVLVESAVGGERHDALFGLQVVELELAHFDVQPTGVQEVVEAHVYRFEVKGGGFVGRGHQLKTDVMCEGAFGQNIEAAEVKAMGRDVGQGGVRPPGAVDDHVVLMFQMPIGSNTHGDRPISGALEDGSVPVVAHLVPVVFELLAKRTEFRPSRVAGRARHAVLSCKGGKGVGGKKSGERHTKKEKRAKKGSRGASASPLKFQKLRPTHPPP